MTDFENSLPADLRRVVAFHGHYCPGIMWGYIASKAGLARLGASRAEDEELIAIVENDSCAADAVQVITGCTFGKGNFFFRDWGKHVYTFALRSPEDPEAPFPQDPEGPSGRGAGREAGRAVRVSRRAEVPDAPDDESREAKVLRMLRADPEDLFTIEETTIDLPDVAHIHDSVLCTRCGEPVMTTRTREVDGKPVCLGCVNAKGNGSR